MSCRNWIAVIVLSAPLVITVKAAPATSPADADSPAAEIKTDEGAIASITAELKQDEKDAADAEALAANPPADISADRKTAYIDSEKNAAQTAHDAVKDAQERLGEARKSLEEARAHQTPTTVPAK